MSKVSWIETDAGLANAAQAWQQADTLYMDTEFIRETTFYSVPALLQVSDGHEAWLVDPLPIHDWSPLAVVMASASITKVFHACQEDVELLARLTGVYPQGIMDSQLAAAFAGLGWSLGYRALTEKLCGVMLDDAPHITRSNWLQRPLSAEQYAYAVNDVLYLAKAWPLLREKLLERGWLDACTNETAARVQQMIGPVDPEDAWKRLGGLERLDDTGVRIARRLHQWREQVAEADDVARNRLMRDGVLLNISKQQPDSMQQLASIEDLRPGVVRRYGQQILAQVGKGQADTQTLDLPSPVDPQLLRRLLSPLKKAVSHWASLHDLPEPLVASRTMLTALLLAWLDGRDLPVWLEGWRAQSLVPELKSVLEKSRDLVDSV